MAGVPRVRTSSLIAVGLAASLLLVGCASGTDAPDSSAPQPAPTPTVSAEPGATPEPPAPEQTTSAEPTRKPRGHKVGTLQPRMRLRTTEHLLDAQRLPTLGDRAWAVGATGPEDPEQDAAVGACQKTLLGTLGAVETVRRTFTAPDRVTATQVVARFADARSAWRAHGVLVAWREDCAERLDRADVGPLEPVTVRAGTGEAYRTVTRKQAAGLGILRTGSYLTLVEVTAGPEHYPGSWDPARVALRRAARTF
jgi:hypothetical protein